MSELPWHEYAGESSDELFDLAASCRADSLVVAFETALDEKALSLGLAALSDPEREVLAIEALEREVNNGGYRQFFLNSSNAHAGRVADALRRIGCAVTASITERAIAALPTGMVLTPEELTATMAQQDQARDAVLDECDQAYYASGEDIAQRLLEYLVAQREAVRFAARIR